jgi:hypothetical protein
MKTLLYGLPPPIRKSGDSFTNAETISHSPVSI